MFWHNCYYDSYFLSVIHETDSLREQCNFFAPAYCSSIVPSATIDCFPKMKQLISAKRVSDGVSDSTDEGAASSPSPPSVSLARLAGAEKMMVKQVSALKELPILGHIPQR